jgi:hypothetical protein
MTKRLEVHAFESGQLPEHSRLERVTGIEPALSVWEANGTTHVTLAELHVRLAMSDRS